MDHIWGMIGSLAQRLSTFWRDVPPGVKRVFLFVAVAGLPLWLTFTSFDVRNYVVGAEQILTGQSVYGPRVRSPVTGNVVPKYPYLPSFAMLLAVGIAPFFLLYSFGILPETIYEMVARQIANAPGYLALIAVPLLAYLVCSNSRHPTEMGSDGSTDWVFWGVLVVAITPALWFQAIESGSDTFVALLALAGVYAVTTDRWLLSGLLVGVATFKFTGLPLAAVLALYALTRGREQFSAVAIGGVGSQLPNILYFGVFVEDFLFVLEQRGAMSLHSGHTDALVTAPFRATGLEQWYIETGFLFAFVILVGLGVAVAVRRRNLVLGFAVAYLATSYFAPVGETNSSVFVVFLLFEAAANLHRPQVRYLTVGLLTVELYSFLFPLRMIGHVSTVPFPWWHTVIRIVEFGTVSIVLLGLIYYSDHGRFRAG